MRNAFKLNHRVSFFQSSQPWWRWQWMNFWEALKEFDEAELSGEGAPGPHRDAGGGINVSSHRARWRKKGISGAEYACRHCFSPSNVLFGNSAGSPRNHCSRLVGNWLLDETALLSHKSSVTIQFDSLYSTEMCLVTLLWHYWSWSLAR